LDSREPVVGLMTSDNAQLEMLLSFLECSSPIKGRFHNRCSYKDISNPTSNFCMQNKRPTPIENKYCGYKRKSGVSKTKLTLEGR
jgi:hypothetical protein